MKRITNLMMLAASAVLIFTACKKEDPEPKLTLSVSASTTDLGVGNTTQITISSDVNVEKDLTVSVSSSNSSVVEVPASAVIQAGTNSIALTATAKAEGTAKISIASSEAKIAVKEVSITVAGEAKPSLSVAVSPSSIAAGSKGTVTVTLDKAASDALTVNLSSDDTNVATVPATLTIASGATSASGDVTAVAEGSAKITITCTGAVVSVGEANVTVTAPAKPVLSVSGNSKVTLNGETTITVTSTVAPSEALTVNVSANNSNVEVPSTITIAAGSTTGTGTLTGKAIGTSTVTISCDAEGVTIGTASFDIEVSERPAGSLKTYVEPETNGYGYSQLKELKINGVTVSGSVTSNNSNCCAYLNLANMASLVSIQTGTTVTAVYLNDGYHDVSGSDDDYEVCLWVDWNNDGTFTAAERQREMLKAGPGKGTKDITFTLTVPNDAAGISTIRVQSNYVGNALKADGSGIVESGTTFDVGYTL